MRNFRKNPREGLVTLFTAVLLAVAGLSLSIIGTQAATGLYQVVMERLQFPMIESEIESFRRDFEQTPCDQRLMLRQQAANWNQRIEHEKQSNRLAYSDWASTDRWSGVERIEAQCAPPAMVKSNN